MEILKRPTSIDFMGQRRTAAIASGVLLLVSVVALTVRGLAFGIDFTGGTLIEVGYEEPADLGEIRATLVEAGFPEAVVQHFGTTRDVLVRIAPRETVDKADLSSEVLRALDVAPEAMRRVEFVGPQVGKELTEQGGLALLFALGAIFVYVALRFEWKFSLGAVAALFHDVLITLGFFSVIGLEFDLTVLAALLAVIGYSLNDTIVVFDRIRENFRVMRRGSSTQVVNGSLNQTLSRTLMTSLTTLIVLLALFFLGGELIHNFSIALMLGVLVGTYSSLYVASTTILALGITKQDLMPVEKEGADQAEARP